MFLKSEIEDGGLIFIIAIWSETSTMAIAGEGKKMNLLEDRQVIEIHKEANSCDSCSNERVSHMEQEKPNTQFKLISGVGILEREWEKGDFKSKCAN